jgi:hypothetical protein
VGTDGKLSGSGTVKVDGRQATGTSGDGSITYAPRSATCPVGVIAPAKAQLSEQGAAALLLMDVSLDNVLKEAGVAVPAGTSAPKVLEQTCNGVAGQANCAKIVQSLGGHTVVQLKPDASGIANTPDLTLGKTYYLFGSAVSQGRKVTWHLPLKAQAGWTKVVLTTANAAP